MALEPRLLSQLTRVLEGAVSDFEKQSRSDVEITLSRVDGQWIVTALHNSGKTVFSGAKRILSGKRTLLYQDNREG